MLKNIDRETLATTVARAVLDALTALEPTQTPEPITPKSATLSQADFAAESELGINRVNELVRAGRIKHVKLGTRNVRIPRSELTDFFARELAGGAK